ncbi:hypothetical protein [Shewanella halifaxensis]|uniref:hypothetical protein n=1 Tax=Shewanella halifaxensis TaxID=271098 RepID=UPI000D598D2C|nr:hypothetical protein [Shewanella halifaxensis]
MKYLLLAIAIFSFQLSAAPSQQDVDVDTVVKLAKYRLSFEICYNQDARYRELPYLKDESIFYMTEILGSLDSQLKKIKSRAKWKIRGETLEKNIVSEYFMEFSPNLLVLQAFMFPEQANSKALLASIRNVVKEGKNNDAFMVDFNNSGGCESRLNSFIRLNDEAERLR